MRPRRAVKPVTSVGEFIPESRDGSNELRPFWIILQLLPQAGNVHVYSASEGAGIVIPDLFQNFPARQRCTAMFQEVPQKLKLSC